MLSLIVIALRFVFLLLLVVILFRLVKWMIADLYRVAEYQTDTRRQEGEQTTVHAAGQPNETQGNFGLMVLESDIPELAEGDSYACGYGELLIGRSESCDVKVAGSYASARHARLYYQAGQYWLEDLHSTNGTYLNGHQVDLPVVLANGDRLRIGRVTFQFVRWAYEMGADH